jgi:CheY-like chemotaxis protein
MRILVVDDEPYIADMLRDCLVAYGHEVEMVMLFDEVVETARRFGADALILDYWIPGGDVRDTLRAVRTELGDLPFVVYSKFGVPRMDEYRQMVEAGVPPGRIVRKREVPRDVSVILDALCVDISLAEQSNGPMRLPVAPAANPRSGDR